MILSLNSRHYQININELLLLFCHISKLNKGINLQIEINFLFQRLPNRQSRLMDDIVHARQLGRRPFADLIRQQVRHALWAKSGYLLEDEIQIRDMGSSIRARCPQCNTWLQLNLDSAAGGTYKWKKFSNHYLRHVRKKIKLYS